MFTIPVQQKMYRGRLNSSRLEHDPNIGRVVTVFDLDGYGDIDLDSTAAAWQPAFEERGLPAWATPGIPEVPPETFEAIYQWFLA